MKKRILASFLSLALVFSLLPMGALAVEDLQNAELSAVMGIPVEPAEVDPACTGLSGCQGEAHDPECPLYTSPDGPEREPDAETPVCTGLPGCEDGAHALKCPLYTAPVEPPASDPNVIPAEIPEEVQTFFGCGGGAGSRGAGHH